MPWTWSLILAVSLPLSLDMEKSTAESLKATEPLPPPASSSEYLTSWCLAIVITCLFFGAFLIALDTNIINVAIPRITSEFHSLEDAAWYGTAYLLTITAFQPIYDSLYKYFQTDIVYRISILIFQDLSRRFL